MSHNNCWKLPVLRGRRVAVACGAVLVGLIAIEAECENADVPADQVLIAPTLPKPLYIDGNPFAASLTQSLPNFERGSRKPTLNFLSPKGTINLVKGIPPTSSCPQPNRGSFSLITDEDANAGDDSVVVLSPGPVWIQFDLKQACDLDRVWVWHTHKNVHVALDVIVQLSDDPYFETGVVTIFNNDNDNTLKLGEGNDPTYIETNHGRLINAGHRKARYVRLWSNGSFEGNGDNHYAEVMIFGRPVGKAK